MADNETKRPECFGTLDTVFPVVDNGLRETPEICMMCSHKTACLKFALAGKDGLTLREACIDRAYASGMITFMERWSRKKDLQRRRKARHSGEV